MCAENLYYLNMFKFNDATKILLFTIEFSKINREELKVRFKIYNAKFCSNYLKTPSSILK